MVRTYYDVLMISPAADSRLITVVYRHLAKRYHPDLDPSPEAAARMAELNEAYGVLIDRAKRDHYDELLSLGAAPPPGNVPTPEGRAMTPPRQPVAPGGQPDALRAQGGEQATVSTPPSPFGEAGPPPANPAPSGSLLTFGRYQGWTLNQVGRVDRDYLEWLSRTTMGRNYRRELDELLRR